MKYEKVTMTPELLNTILKVVIPKDLHELYQNGETDLDRLKVRTIQWFKAIGIKDYPRMLEDVNSLIYEAIVEVYDPEVQI